MLVDEPAVHPPVVHHVLEHAVEETDVAADVHAEEPVGDLGTEDRALHIGRHPVPVHARLAVGVDADHLRTGLLGVVQVLHRHRLVVGHVGADEDDQVGTDPVAVRAGGGGHPERALEPERARRVADPGRVVDGVAAERPDRLLRGEVVLVGRAAAGQVHPEALRVDPAQPAGDQVQRGVPVDRGEPGLAGPAQHRVRQPAERAQLAS